MTLPFRHGILGPSTLPLGHRGSPLYITFTSERDETLNFSSEHQLVNNIFFSLKRTHNIVPLIYSISNQSFANIDV